MAGKNVPQLAGQGLFLIPDAHVAATPPGQRLAGYAEQILAKVEACLNRAAELSLVPVFVGDLFHWPRENPNSLLVQLIGLFGPHHPVVLVGNHDKYQARFTRDVSLAVLDAAGVVRLLAEPGPAFEFTAGGKRVLVGGTPDGFPLPKKVDDTGYDQVVWLTHHNINFPDFADRQERMREIPGVDWIINGHIHRPQPTQVHGRTRWANPGNMVRLTFSRLSQAKVPRAHIWRPGADDLEPWEVPHRTFGEVFPDQDFPPEEQAAEGSRFLQGLERLSWRRTREGAGLKDFLDANVQPDTPEGRLIWQLYEEVVGDHGQ